MATVAPTDLNFFTARFTTPALRGAAPDVNILRERKSYLLVAGQELIQVGT
jgi:hypothetical protein